MRCNRIYAAERVQSVCLYRVTYWWSVRSRRAFAAGPKRAAAMRMRQRIVFVLLACVCLCNSSPYDKTLNANDKITSLVCLRAARWLSARARLLKRANERLCGNARRVTPTQVRFGRRPRARQISRRCVCLQTRRVTCHASARPPIGQRQVRRARAYQSNLSEIGARCSLTRKQN